MDGWREEGRFVSRIFMLACLHFCLADKWGQTWIFHGQRCWIIFSKWRPDDLMLVKKLVLLKDPDPFLCLQHPNTKNEYAASQLRVLRISCLVECNCRELFFFFVLCSTFLRMAITNSTRRAANKWVVPYTLCKYLHFKIVLDKFQRLADKWICLPLFSC